ncbi:MAG TPA: MerR family transcriptional regulator [Flavobacteriales bacterium]|nr:MerR family transcriptional regulator [Flavobacteriales bacterium]
MGSYSIKDLERLSLVKAHTIRVWEKRYGLLAPERSDTNIRAYGDDDLRKLLNVSLLNNRGVKISRIAKLNDKQIQEKVLELEGSPDGPADMMENLILAMGEMDETRFERAMAVGIERLGFEQCVLQVLMPFLQRVGILWQAGAVRPGQEHFISNLIRQKVVAAIDALQVSPRERARNVFLFLPEGEMHEIGLLFSHYLVRKAGHRSVYLGQSVPFVDLVAVAERHPPSMLITSMTTTSEPSEALAYVQRLKTQFPQARVLFNSPHVIQAEELPSGVQQVKGLASIVQALG